MDGRKTSGFLAKLKTYHSPAVARNVPLIIKSATGATLHDVDGNGYLDFVANYESTNIGHNHPHVVDAVVRQAGDLLQAFCGFGSEPYVLLGERLAEALPGELNVSMFMNSGSEAVETALKLARFHTRRPLFLSFEWSFHGRTFATLHLSGTNPARRRRIEPILPGVIHAPFPYSYRPTVGTGADDCVDAALNYIETTIFSRLAPPDEFAAIIVEPILVQGGVIVPPDDWLPRLRELCTRHGILLIIDEAATGMGRTGTMLASEHWNVIPDIVTLAGGLSPLPLSAAVGTSAIMGTWTPGSQGTTFGGNPVACAGALAVLDVLRDGRVLPEVERKGAYLQSRLAALQEKYPLIGQIRGKGLIVGVELVRDQRTREPAREESAKLAFEECFKRGLLIMRCGLSTIKFCPPLTIEDEQLDAAVSIFEDSLRSLGRGGM